MRVVPVQRQRPAPSLSVMSLCVRTVYNLKSKQNEVVLATALIHRSVLADEPTEAPERNYVSYTAVRQVIIVFVVVDFVFVILL